MLHIGQLFLKCFFEIDEVFEPFPLHMLVLFAILLHIYTRLLEVFPWADYSESASLKLMSLLDQGSMMNC